MTEPIHEDVPKLPRGRGITLSRPQLVRILGLILVLFVLLVMQRPCSNAVSTFVTGFDQGSAAKPNHAGSGSGAAPAGSATAAGSDSLDRYEHLRPGMTDGEVKAVIDRARVKAGSAAAGSAASPAGSAAPAAGSAVAR